MTLPTTPADLPAAIDRILSIHAGMTYHEHAHPAGVAVAPAREITEPRLEAWTL